MSQSYDYNLDPPEEDRIKECPCGHYMYKSWTGNFYICGDSVCTEAEDAI